MHMFKATHFIITPKAGSSAYGFGFSKSPKQAVELAKANAWDGLARWDHYNGQCSSVGGECTHLLDARNERVLHQDLDL
jgi:hypothetical protein